MNRLVVLLTALLVLIPAVRPGAAGTAPAATPGPGDADPALYAAVLPGQRDDIYATTAGRLTRYRIAASLTPAGDRPATIAGTLDLLYVNDTGKDQAALPFRLYPNDGQYAEGGMTLSDASAGGAPVTPVLSVAATVATLPLPAPVPANGTVDVRLSFVTTIPTDPAQSYGIFAFERRTGTYALEHWEPLLAGYDPLTGWNLAPPSVIGDPVFTNTGIWDVTLTAPSDLVFAATGTQVADQAVGTQTRHRFVSGPVRDFVLAASADFTSDHRQVGGTTVTSYFHAGDAQGGEEVLDEGAQALAIYGRLFGPYPYAQLNLVEVRMGNGAAGDQFPQLVFIGSDAYGQSAPTRTIPRFLEFVVAHEVGHQWWYGLVGNDPYAAAYLHEGLTNYSTTIYFAERYGTDVARQQVDLNLKLPYFRLLLGQNKDEIVEQWTDDFPSQGDYGAIVYGKGALGFDALRQRIGDAAFFAGLQGYLQTMRFKVATPDDLRAAFERASGQDLAEFWQHWFRAAEGRQDFRPQDLTDLLKRLGGG